jgi:hypothetical protein
VRVMTATRSCDEGTTVSAGCTSAGAERALAG